MKALIQTKNRGFTLIELLVVVAIIGLLLSIISIALSAARVKSRDTRRISDMKQIKTGMDVYFSNGAGYADTATWNGNIGQQLTCGSVDIMRVPQDPSTPLYAYTFTASGASYAGCGTTVRTHYTVQFYMENKGAYYNMDEDGTVRDSNGNAVSFDSLL